MIKHASLFSGIGGFDLAASMVGWENVLHCEMNPFAQKILKYYWPNATLYEDIKKTDFRKYRGTIDIVSGGFPCQPFSAAGKRRGTEDDRHLWPEMLRAIREIQPTWVVGENVRGIVNWSDGLVFEQVCSELEAEGYEVQPFLLPACGVNAPHQRMRAWFVAYSPSYRTTSNRCGDRTSGQRRSSVQETNEGRESEAIQSDRLRGVSQTVANSDEDGRSRLSKTSKNNDKGIEEGLAEGLITDTQGSTKPTAHSYSERLERKTSLRVQDGQGRRNQYDDEVPSGGDWWEEFPTQSPICSRDDGLSELLDNITFPKWRKESIAAYGNAVVPKLVIQIFKTINDYESQRNNN